MIQRHYKGFVNTPVLWQKNTVFDLAQFEIETTISQINIHLDKTLRLGKYVERLVSFQLHQNPNITIVAENVQIQKGKETLGELDFLLVQKETPMHLEVIYKFYVYDPTVGETEIDHFIGPNRKDALKTKLIKLKKKQLPLLYSEACAPYLETFNLDVNLMEQRVYFKAQLFLPFFGQHIQLQLLNNNCIKGFYINSNQLRHLEDGKFYVPKKKDWLTEPCTQVNWLSFQNFKTLAQTFIAEQYAALFWVKFKNGVIQKAFFVWW
ncbi:DUF1853 family protein [Tamlana fucoidanivorans]|uniref:DUF1853 family protein n=1 Tax=Allotamlana fucoidanivorans TaxID=2583814 RepID=A0A5C4SMH6_9FLAO|nr:DUF1853 family protein [Tamlana fucoidanivorans]TNJ45317.1 DUF1853 family protein [Tamlana fucoidanivorans]